MEQHPRTKAEMESAVAPTLERLGWTVEGVVSENGK